MRVRPLPLLALLAGLGAVPALGALPASADDFGTAPVTGSALTADGTGAAVRTVTVGRHATFDRVVFTAEAGLPRWELRYVPGVTQDGSGTPVPLDGAADLFLVFRGTAWTDHPSPPQRLTPGYAGLRQLSSAGEFEGDLSYGIGQATRAGFRAFTLTGPNRLVVDVAHPAGSSASPSASPPASGATGPVAAERTTAGAVGSTPAGSPAAVEPVASVTDVDAGSGWSGPALLIGGGLLLLGALTAAGVLVHTRRSP